MVEETLRRIYLIPKKAGAVDIDFCPISLVGAIYKIISKVLANKLEKGVGKIISSSQNAFIFFFFLDK
jgi:hypothetical protein